MTLAKYSGERFVDENAVREKPARRGYVRRHPNLYPGKLSPAWVEELVTRVRTPVRFDILPEQLRDALEPADKIRLQKVGKRKAGGPDEFAVATARLAIRACARVTGVERDERVDAFCLAYELADDGRRGEAVIALALALELLDRGAK